MLQRPMEPKVCSILVRSILENFDRRIARFVFTQIFPRRELGFRSAKNFLLSGKTRMKSLPVFSDAISAMPGFQLRNLRQEMLFTIFRVGRM